MYSPPVSWSCVLPGSLLFTVSGEGAGDSCLVTKSFHFRGEIDLRKWAISNCAVGGPNLEEASRPSLVVQLVVQTWWSKPSELSPGSIFGGQHRWLPWWSIWWSIFNGSLQVQPGGPTDGPNGGWLVVQLGVQLMVQEGKQDQSTKWMATLFGSFSHFISP